MKQLSAYNDKSCNGGGGGTINAANKAPDHKASNSVVICQEKSQDKHKLKEQPVASLFGFVSTVFFE